MPAYLDGLHHALYALAWLAGALTVAGTLGAAVYAALTLAEPAYRRAGAWAVRHRYARHHARSGRTTGPQ